MENGPGKYEHKRMRDWYFDGYQPTEVTDDNGKVRVKYEYHGKYYSFGLDDGGRRSMKKRFALTSLLCLAVYVVGLLLPSRLGTTLPGAIYLFFIMPLAYYVIGLYNFLFLKQEFTTRELYSSVRRMNISVWIMAILGGVSVVVSVYYWIARLETFTLLMELAFVLCAAVSTLLSIVLIRLTNRYDYQMTRDESKE